MCQGCSRDSNSEEQRLVKSSETCLGAAGFRQEEGSREKAVARGKQALPCGSCRDRAERVRGRRLRRCGGAESSGRPWESPGKLEGEGPSAERLRSKAFTVFGLEFSEEPGLGESERRQ